MKITSQYIPGSPVNKAPAAIPINEQRYKGLLPFYAKVAKCLKSWHSDHAKDEEEVVGVEPWRVAEALSLEVDEGKKRVEQAAVSMGLELVYGEIKFKDRNGRTRKGVRRAIEVDVHRLRKWVSQVKAL